MQWIFLLLGLVLGGAFDESLEGAAWGALLGLGLGQALLLSATRKQLALLHERLARLEARPAPAAPLNELVWELPDLATSAPAPAPAVALPNEIPHEHFLTRLASSARAWLLGGNSVLRVGLVLLFLGLAFLLRYATEQFGLPVELRYAAVASAALLLLVFGWRLRERRSAYGLLMQGGGVAVLYLTVFAAMRLNSVIEPGPAFALLLVITVFAALLALWQDAIGLAAAAALGGFAAPILASTGSASHVALFSYFILLNAGILGIAWFKAWRLLNLIGFVGTFGIGLAWGLRDYQPSMFWSTEPFLLVLFFMYLAIAVLTARRGDYLDGGIVFGPPLAAFGLQLALVRPFEFGAAFSALGLGLVYLLLAKALWRRASRSSPLLVEACLALGVIFTSLAIPLALEARWTSLAWALEGAGIYWLAVQQKRLLARLFGLFLQCAAGLFLLADLMKLAGFDTLMAGVPQTALLLGGCYLFSYVQLHQAPHASVSRWERRLCLPLLALAAVSALSLLGPLWFEYAGTTIFWALLGLGCLYAAQVLQSRSFLAGAFMLQGLAGMLFVFFGPGLAGFLPALGLLPGLHLDFWAPMAVSLAGLASARSLFIESGAPLRQAFARQLSHLLLAWGALWWLAGWNAEILRFAGPAFIEGLQLLVLAASLVLCLWLGRRLAWPPLAALAWVLAPLMLLVVSMAWLRIAHYLFGIPWQADALLDSMPVQAGLSLLWTLVALGLMLAGHKRVRRWVWLAGAGLIAVVVGKLFFVELSSQGGLARIVSFIGVGVLLLVVGYFAPLPPGRGLQPGAPSKEGSVS
jgi:uncharacterized membrane protein